MEIEKFFVYVLVNKDKRLYVGFTNDLERRLMEHNSCQQKSTKSYAPWEIIYYEEVVGRGNARAREKYFKGASFKERIKQKLIP